MPRSPSDRIVCGATTRSSREIQKLKNKVEMLKKMIEESQRGERETRLENVRAVAKIRELEKFILEKGLETTPQSTSQPSTSAPTTSLTTNSYHGEPSSCTSNPSPIQTEHQDRTRPPTTPPDEKPNPSGKLCSGTECQLFRSIIQSEKDSELAFYQLTVKGAEKERNKSEDEVKLLKEREADLLRLLAMERYAHEESTAALRVRLAEKEQRVEKLKTEVEKEREDVKHLESQKKELERLLEMEKTEQAAKVDSVKKANSEVFNEFMKIAEEMMDFNSPEPSQ